MDEEVRKESAKIFKKQGFDFKTRHQGHRRHRQRRQGDADGRAGQGRRSRDDRGRRRARLDRPPPQHRRPRRSTRSASQLNKRGQIETDHDFRTAVPSIWAIGDVIPGPMLAHKAEDEGIAVGREYRRPDRDREPRGDPVGGLHPSRDRRRRPDRRAGQGSRARDQGRQIPVLANSRAKTNRDTDGFVKVIADAKTDRVLGVWMHLLAWPER